MTAPPDRVRASVVVLLFHNLAPESSRLVGPNAFAFFLGQSQAAIGPVRNGRICRFAERRPIVSELEGGDAWLSDSVFGTACRGLTPCTWCRIRLKVAARR